MNKRNIKLFIPFLLIIFVMIFSINHFQESADVNRGPAAFSSQACKEMIKDLLSKSGEVIKTASHAVTDKIAELNYGTRLKYLEFLGHHQFLSNKLNYKYAELINNSLKKKIITDEEAESLVSRLKTKGFNQIYMENHKAYPYIIDSLASTAQIEEASLKLKTELRSNFKKELEGMEISKRELESLSLIQSEINTEEDLSRAISYLDFSKTFKESERPECLNDLEYLYSGNEQSSYLKTFDKNQKKILKYTLKKGKAQGQIYQKLLYSCQAKGSTLEKSATNKRFFQTVIGLELTISSGAYLFVHRDEEKTDDWYKKFMVEILLKLGIAGARSGITTMSATEWYKKALQDYSLGVVNDVGPALGYSAAFSPSKKELKEKLDQMMEDPEFKEKVKRLEEILKEDGLLDKYKTQVTTANGEQVTVDSIKSNEEAKDLLMDALAKDIYEDQQGEWIQTGDVGLDRYIFNRIWGVQSSVRNIVVNLMIYRTLCMGKINPKEAYLTAIGIYSANKLISEPLYQSLREKGINQ